MRVSVSTSSTMTLEFRATDWVQDPEIQKKVGSNDPVEVMQKLREMKNNS